MKLDRADVIFSKYIRLRDKFTCQRCYTKYEKGNGLQASHYFGRRMESVRFDEDNVDSLCYPCHRFWEKEDREAYREFKIKQLGKKGFDDLMLRAHMTHKKDRKMAYIIWNEAYKELLKES